MANASEKKRAQRAQAAIRYLAMGFSIVTGIPLVVQAGIFSEQEENWLLYLGLQTLLSMALCYRIVGLELQGYSHEYSFDLLILNWVVQIGSLYSPLVWKLFYLVPLFALYKGGALLASYVFTPKEAELPPDAAEVARLEKKQRKQERQMARGGSVVTQRS